MTCRPAWSICLPTVSGAQGLAPANADAFGLCWLARRTSLTAGMVLNKLRRVRVNPECTLLAGEVEVDEGEVCGVERGGSGGRSPMAKAAHGVVGVEVRGQGSLRIRGQVIPEASGRTLYSFVHDTVAPGAVVPTDGWGP